MVVSKIVSIGTAATSITGAVEDTIGHSGGTGPASRRLVIRNPSGTSSVYLGGPDVTTSNGLQVAAGEQITLDLMPTDEIYGVASLTQDVQTLHMGV